MNNQCVEMDKEEDISRNKNQSQMLCTAKETNVMKNWKSVLYYSYHDFINYLGKFTTPN